MKLSKSSTKLPADGTAIRPDDYANSPIHYSVATRDHAALDKIISSLPKLSDPTRINTEPKSIAEEHRAEQISKALNGRDNPRKETALHLAVRLNDPIAARAIAAAGANINLYNSAGWNPLQEAILRHCKDIAPILCHHQQQTTWAKWRRRQPRLLAALGRIRDFYMEMSFNFESFFPFVAKIAPSDTYKIWKRGGNIRADFSMSGYDGLNIKRGNNSFLFITENISDFQDRAKHIPMRIGTSLAIRHDTKEILVASPTEKEEYKPLSEAEIEKRCKRNVNMRPTMDVSKAELTSCKNWRWQDRTEKVGEWKTRVYELNNVILSLRSRKANKNQAVETGALPQLTETQMSASLRPMVWLTDQFPLMVDDFHRLLHILSKKIKAVRRVKEVLKTTFPPGTFPVKVAIPVIPAVKVVVAITKFVELQPIDKEFYTPPSSPKHSEDEEDESISVDNTTYLSFPSQRKGRRGRKQKDTSDEHVVDPFMIPNGYKWANSNQWLEMTHIWGANWVIIAGPLKGPFSVKLTTLSTGKTLSARDVIPRNWTPRATYTSRLNF